MIFTVSYKKRILFLLLAFVLGFALTSIFYGVVAMAFGIQSTKATRIVAVVQDLLVFVMPAIATALLVCRQPAQLLCVAAKPMAMPLVLAACTLVCSLPAMEAIIWLNQQLPLPEGIELMLKDMEESAQQMVTTLQGPHTIGNLIMSVLIVGILTGFSEELLFRGALQRLMTTGGMNVHAAIWVSAILFSLLHLQVYGFVPRVLLGAFFGYALYWTGSIWVPILLHILNNVMYLVTQWMLGDSSAVPSDFGSLSTFILIVASVILTIFGLSLTRKAAAALRR